MNRVSIIAIGLAAVFAHTACVSRRTVAGPVQFVPANYPGVPDTTNTAAAGWRTFYADSALRVLIDTALANNQDLQMALRRINVSRANVLLTKGSLFPTVAGVLRSGQRRFGKYTMDGVGNYDTRFSPNITEDQVIPEHLPEYYVGFQASWEADIWGKLRNRRKAAFARYLAGVEGRNWLITNLVAEIAFLYYELQTLDNETQIIRQTVTLQENALAIITLQKEAGAANELAVKQFEAQLLRTKGLLIEKEQDITQCELRLNLLCGRFPQPVARRANDFRNTLPAEVSAGVPAQLISNRPDIRQAELELNAAKADLLAARAAFYPSLTLNGDIGYQAFNAAFWLSTPQSLAYSIFGNLVAPLINRSSIESQYRSANAQQQELLYRYQKTVLNAFTEVNLELARIRNLEKMYQLKEKETEVLTSSIETSSALFRSGRATYLEVLMSQQNALRSRIELVETRKQQYQAMVNIYRALGGGWRP